MLALEFRLRSEDNLWKSILPFHHEDPRDQTQLVRLGCRQLCPFYSSLWALLSCYYYCFIWDIGLKLTVDFQNMFLHLLAFGPWKDHKSHVSLAWWRKGCLWILHIVISTTLCTGDVCQVFIEKSVRKIKMKGESCNVYKFQVCKY